MTKASFTAMQAIASTPLARNASACSLKPGRWRAEQVGVKAPGTPNSTTVRPAKNSAVSCSWGPSGVARMSLTEGIVSPG